MFTAANVYFGLKAGLPPEPAEAGEVVVEDKAASEGDGIRGGARPAQMQQ